MPADQLFYVGQKAFIRKGGSVLTLLDAEYRVDFPGGKIQVGERDFDAALQREVREETFLEIRVGNPFIRWQHMRWQMRQLPGQPEQRQELYLIGFFCDYVSGDVVLSEEHTDFRWVTLQNYQVLNDGSARYAALEACFRLYS